MLKDLPRRNWSEVVSNEVFQMVFRCFFANHYWKNPAWATKRTSPYFPLYPKGSMYGIFTYIYHKNQRNVAIYTIHGSYGYWLFHRDPDPFFMAYHPPWKLTELEPILATQVKSGKSTKPHMTWKGSKILGVIFSTKKSAGAKFDQISARSLGGKNPS